MVSYTFRSVIDGHIVMLGRKPINQHWIVYTKLVDWKD